MGRVSAVASAILRTYRFPILEILLGISLLVAVVTCSTSLATLVSTTTIASMPSSKILAIQLASVASGFPVFIAFIASVVYGWSFASSVSRGEVLTILSMPVSRVEVLSLAAVGCVAIPTALAWVSTTIAILAVPPRNLIDVGYATLATLATVARASICFASIYATTALTKSRWGALASGLATYFGLSVAASILAMLVSRCRELRASLGPILVALDPVASSRLLSRAWGVDPATVLAEGIAVDVAIALALAIPVIVVYGRRWEPV